MDSLELSTSTRRCMVSGVGIFFLGAGAIHELWHPPHVEFLQLVPQPPI